MELIIDESNAGKTIRQLLRSDLGFSSSMLKKLKFSEGGILVNGEFRTVRYELLKGDVLYLATEDTSDNVSPYIIPVSLPLDIIYSDDDLDVINKPPNMPSHPSYGHRDDTVANALAYVYSPLPYVFRPVNRLDRDTSGAMLVAKNRLSAYTMYKSMVDGRIKKEYVALLSGRLKEESGVIETYMKRCDDSIVKREVCSETEGKFARTYFKTLITNSDYTLVKAYPETGRTHQLRVHFASKGAWICGDTLYGCESSVIGRQALHAYSVEFPLPSDRSCKKITAPLLDDMLIAIIDVFSITTNDLNKLLTEN